MALVRWNGVGGRVWRVLKRPRAFWTFVFGSAGLLLISAIWSGGLSGSFARHFGLLLEVAGLGMVALELNGLRKAFGKPGLLAGFWRWCKELIEAFNPPPIIVTPQSAVVTVHAGDVTVQVGTKSSNLGQRLRVVEENLATLEQTVARHSRDSKAALARLTGELDAQSEKAAAAQRRAEKRLESVMVGDWHLAAVGIAWLLLGAIFSGLAPELSALINRAA